MQSNWLVIATPGSHAVRRQCLPLVLFISLWILLTSCSTAGVSQDQGLAQDRESWDSSRRKEAERVFETRIRSFIAQGTIPIIDVEHHFPGAVAIEQVVERMDRNGVALTWLGPGEKRGSAFSVSLHRRFPDRIVPTIVHGDGPLWHSRNAEFLRQLEEDAASGRYWAMGEFEARHYISSTNDRDVHLPVDSESFHVVFRISEMTGLPFLLHHEAEDRLLPELERMLVRYPKAKVVWCHVGRNRNPQTWTRFPTPAGVKEFIEKYPNLSFDINQAPPGARHRGTGYTDSVLYTQYINQVELKPEWKQLFQAFPERFLVGSDANPGRWPNYDQTIARFRSLMLANLDRRTAEKIAFKNAWKLMTREEWQD